MKATDEAKRQANFLRLCELPVDSENRTLENFKILPGSNLQQAYDAAVDVINGKLQFLTLISSVDRGKTHLAIAICRKWMEMGKTAKYAFVPLLLEELKAGFGQKGEGSYDSRFNFYLNVSLLVLDDLGAEHQTAWAIEKLETIVDHRYMNHLPIVVTTNCELPKLTPRIQSRLQRAEKSRVVVISAPEYRLTKGKK